MLVDKTHLIENHIPMLAYGVAVLDVDGDGFFEFFVTGYNGFANRVLKWTGHNLHDIADSTLEDGERNAIGVAAADIDEDGQEEIYILNTDTFMGRKRFGDRLFDRVDDVWTDLCSLPINTRVLNLTAGRSVAAVDRFGRGRYGFFVANYGGPMRLYELDDDGLLQESAAAAGLALTTGGRALAALPLLTAHMDIFAGNENGPNFLFRNRGDGTYEEVAAQFGLSDRYEAARGVAVLDANGDGRFDLVYGNWEGAHRLFVQQDNNFRDIAPQALASASRVRTVIAADFDNDGHEEIFFNNLGQPNRLFAYRNHLWMQVNMGDAAEPSGLGTGAAVADVDGDGRLELLIAHGEAAAQPLTYYHATPNANAWLRVYVLTKHGAPARGAVVRLLWPDHPQVRVIDAGSGYLCQMEPIAHFGLGPNPPDHLRIEVQWLDGTKRTISGLHPNQVVRVAYNG
jgi:hypothetical protein